MTAVVTPLLTTVTAADDATGGAWTLGVLDTESNVQGTGCYGNSVSTTREAVFFTRTTALNVANSHIYIWLLNTTATKLQSKALGGMRVRIGSSSTAYYEWDVAGADTYPGGWICFAVDTASTVGRTTTGAPNLTAATVFGASMQMAATVRTQVINMFIDAIRFGSGLQVSGGTSGSPSTFAEVLGEDFLTTNKYGIVRSVAGVTLIQGKIVQTGGIFTDTNAVVVFEPALTAATLYEIQVAAGATMNLGSFAGSVSQSGCTITAATGYRWLLNVLGTINIYASTIARANAVNLTAASVVRDTSFSACGLITPNGALLRDVTIAGSPDPVAMTIASITQMDNIRRTSLLGNQIAVRITAPGTYTFDAIQFSGNVTDIRNESGGLVTINAANGSNPATVTNSTGSTTVINNAKTFSLTGLQTGSEVRIYRASDNVELFGAESSGSSVTYSYNYAADTPIYVHIAHVNYVFVRLDLTLTAENASVPVQQRFDRVYNNPETVATTPVNVAVGRFGLAVSTPATRTSHSVRINARSVQGGGTLIYSLHEGTTERASFTTTLTSTLTEYTGTLTQAQMDSISNYSALEIRLSATKTSGPLTVEVSEASLTVPSP